MNSLWNDFIEGFGTACSQIRECIVQARSAADVIAILDGTQAQPVAPVAGQDGRLLNGLCSAMIEAIHHQAISDLHTTPQAQFERLLQWHIVHNLEPCRTTFPALHAEFEMKLQRAACTRWLLDARQESQIVH